MNENEKHAHEIALAALPALLVNKKLDKAFGVSIYSTYLDAYNSCLSEIQEQQEG